MDRDAALALLDDLKTDLHDRFPGADARLAQLDGHLATVAMVVNHLFDEDERTA